MPFQAGMTVRYKVLMAFQIFWKNLRGQVNHVLGFLGQITSFAQVQMAAGSSLKGSPPTMAAMPWIAQERFLIVIKTMSGQYKGLPARGRPLLFGNRIKDHRPIDMHIFAACKILIRNQKYSPRTIP